MLLRGPAATAIENRWSSKLSGGSVFFSRPVLRVVKTVSSDHGQSRSWGIQKCWINSHRVGNVLEGFMGAVAVSHPFGLFAVLRSLVYPLDIVACGKPGTALIPSGTLRPADLDPLRGLQFSDDCYLLTLRKKKKRFRSLVLSTSLHSSVVSFTILRIVLHKEKLSCPIIFI